MCGDGRVCGGPIEVRVEDRGVHVQQEVRPALDPPSAAGYPAEEVPMPHPRTPSLPEADDASEDTLTGGLDLSAAELQRRRELVVIADRIRAMTPGRLTVSSVELLREDRAR